MGTLRTGSVAAEALADRLLAAGETLEPRTTGYFPHPPHVGPQALFLSPIVTQLREVFYGGAAGGGKTDALLMAALQFVDVPGYAAVLIRKTYPMLNQPGGLIPRSHAWLDASDARWNQGEHRWSFPSGATVTFRHLNDASAVEDYQGGEYQFIGVDEVTDFAEVTYRFMFSRLRKVVGVDVPLRMRSCSNPTGPGRKWVHLRFVVNGRERRRLFIPARLEDNPALDRGEYERSLIELGSIAYRQLRYGDWDVKPAGKTFKRSWFEDAIVAPTAVPSDVQHVRFWDLAASDTPKGKAAKALNDPDWTAGVLLARDDRGIYYLDDVAHFRKEPASTEEAIGQVADEDGREVPIRMEQEGGASGKSLISHYRRNILDGFDFRGIPSTGSKETRANPVAARAEAGELKLVAGPWVEDFLDELCEFPDGLHDDQVDALSGAYGALAGRRQGRNPAPAIGVALGSHWRDA